MIKGAVCIVQARMSSTRLPGKTLIDICGQTALERLISRLSNCQSFEKIVVATTTKKGDDVIEKEVERLKVKYPQLAVFRGSERDVLGRYFEAAKKFKARYIARVTGDCPLLDPRVTDKVVETLVDSGSEIGFAANTVRRTYPRGLDTAVFTWQALEKANREARETRYREHVGAYAHEHPREFNKISVEADRDYSFYRLTLDTAEDLALIRAVYKNFGNKPFYLEDIVEFLSKHPEVAKINSQAKRKSLTNN